MRAGLVLRVEVLTACEPMRNGVALSLFSALLPPLTWLLGLSFVVWRYVVLVVAANNELLHLELLTGCRVLSMSTECCGGQGLCYGPDGWMGLCAPPMWSTCCVWHVFDRPGTLRILWSPLR
jgi:hypothetical protein